MEVASSQPLPRQQHQGRKRRSSTAAIEPGEDDQQNNEPETVSVATEDSRPTRSLFLARVRCHEVTPVENRPSSVLHSGEHTHVQGSNNYMTEHCSSDNHFDALTNTQCSPFDQSRPLPDDDSHGFLLSQPVSISLKDIDSDLLSASPYCEHGSEDDVLNSVSACRFDFTTNNNRRQPLITDDGNDDFDVLGSSPFLNSSFQCQAGSQIDKSIALLSTPANTPNSPFNELIDMSFASEDISMYTANELSTQVETSAQSQNSLNEEGALPFLSLAGNHDQLFLQILFFLNRLLNCKRHYWKYMHEIS